MRVCEIHPHPIPFENLWMDLFKNRCHYLIDHNRRNKLIAAILQRPKTWS